mgnify:CR=1 FL=1
MTASRVLIDASVALIERTREADATARTVIVGINGPQGGGKSTLAAALVEELRDRGETAIAISIDDFYLPRAEQVALAARHPGNRYLEHRGYPGTHDVELGARTLADLRRAGAGDVVRIPVYDKSAHHGRGDRAPISTWPSVRGPVDVVLFEGWMLGFPDVTADGADRHLATAASFVRQYAPWSREIEAFIQLEVDDLETIVAWRVDAERARRRAGAETLSDEAVRDYIERFLPAYRLWLPALRDRPPTRDGRPVSSLRVRLGTDRSPIEIVGR